MYAIETSLYLIAYELKLRSRETIVAPFEREDSGTVLERR